jgi:hypothetical protein
VVPTKAACHTRRVTASYSFIAELWLYPGEAGWHFLTLPAEVADEVRVLTAGASKAFGSIKVMAEVGGESWQTSLFRDTKSGSYLLPVKKAIRDKARISEGDEVKVHLSFEGL